MVFIHFEPREWLQNGVKKYKVSMFIRLSFISSLGSGCKMAWTTTEASISIWFSIISNLRSGRKMLSGIMKLPMIIWFSFISSLGGGCYMAKTKNERIYSHLIFSQWLMSSSVSGCKWHIQMTKASICYLIPIHFKPREWLQNSITNNKGVDFSFDFPSFWASGVVAK